MPKMVQAGLIVCGFISICALTGYGIGLLLVALHTNIIVQLLTIGILYIVCYKIGKKIGKAIELL